MLFLELEGLFKGIGVGLIEGVLEVGFFNPLGVSVDANLCIAIWNLFDGYDDLHSKNLRSY